MCQYPRQRRHSQPPLPHAQPLLNTCSQIATHLKSHYRPYIILNFDISVEFAQQHASCVDMTIRASIYKSRVSILPTYNINTSDRHTHTTHCHALHQHRTTSTSTTANISDPNTQILATNRRYMKNIYTNNKIDRIDRVLKNIINNQMQWRNN